VPWPAALHRLVLPAGAGRRPAGDSFFNPLERIWSSHRVGEQVLARVQLEVVCYTQRAPVVVQVHVLAERDELVFQAMVVKHWRRDGFVVKRLFFERFFEIRF
jgi:hypothetical protein